MAAHAFTWFSSARDTAELASEVNDASAIQRWHAALTYVKAFRPSFPVGFQITSAPPEDPAILTVEQGYDALAAFIDAYNRLGVTEADLFASYIDADPASWPEWLSCLGISA